ncbi:MAG: histidine phosphatase family protein [Jatrophihabitantaceae bacterium]
MESVELWLIRHGETEWSKSGQHTGRTDLPLTATGEAQARALGGLLAAVRPVLVLCSPRERALSTARIAGLSVDAVDDDLAEWDYGDYEGLTTKQIRERVPGWTVWTHPSPSGETIEQVCARADRVLHRAAARLGDGPVVLISHGHFSRVVGARWIGLPAHAGARLALETAAPSLLSTQHDVRVIDRWNMVNPATTEGNAP